MICIPAIRRLVHSATASPLLFCLAMSAQAAPDLAVRKTVDNPTPLRDEPVEFTVEISNVGDAAAADVRVLDALPAGLEIPDGLAPFASVGFYDEATGDWAVDMLAPEMGAVLLIPAMVVGADPPDCLVNAAESVHAEDDNSSNDRAVAAVRQPGISRCVDLHVSFGISNSPTPHSFPVCDSRERYTGDVTITNRGPDAARNVVVTISQDPVIGAKLRFDDSDCAGLPGPQCTLGEIAGGESFELNVTSDLYQHYRSREQTITVRTASSDTEYAPSDNVGSDTGSTFAFSDCREPDFGVPDSSVPPACFIATAAYGSALDPHVTVLRRFRDRQLMTHPWGRAFVDVYYTYSPPIADYVSDRPGLRAAIRTLLWPVVFGISHPVLTPIALMLLSASLLALVARRRRSV